MVAIDLSPTLVRLAAQRTEGPGSGSIEFRVGDMLDPSLGRFDHVVAMDSLIHYEATDMLRMVAGLARRAQASLLFTFAPRTAPLTVMHAAGKLFPRGDRSPAIEPITERRLRRGIAEHPELAGWQSHRTRRVARGFYISQALEVVRA